MMKFYFRTRPGDGFNEKTRLAERYVRFNVSELMHVAANAVHREECVKIEKLAEGGFNKVFLLTMNDGYKVIARIPTSIAGPPGFTTASEVATLDLLNSLGIPVPTVFAHCSRKGEDNSVEAEYIIMERLHGESLAERWDTLSQADLADVMKQVATIETKLMNVPLPAYGSLFYKDDVEVARQVAFPNTASNANHLLGRMCIGPVAKSAFWHGERQSLNIDRGPWHTPAGYLRAVGAREATWTSKLGLPRPRTFFSSFTDHSIDPQAHLSLLSMYDIVSPYLVPKDSELCVPMLRHPDLNSANILLHLKSTKILGIIDWQGASALPLFMQVGFPSFCGMDLQNPITLVAPVLPGNFDIMDEHHQKTAMEGLQRARASRYYLAAIGLSSKLHWRALSIPYIGMLHYLVRQAGLSWDGDLVNFRMALLGLIRKWRQIVGDAPCPISFTEEEEMITLQDSADWNDAEQVLNLARGSMGIDPEGGTTPTNFEFAKYMNQTWRTQVWTEADAHEKGKAWQIWPYKDDSDTSMAPNELTNI